MKTSEESVISLPTTSAARSAKGALVHLAKAPQAAGPAEDLGAGDGNRAHMASLEGLGLKAPCWLVNAK